MNQLGVIHPDMLSRLHPNFYPAVCAIHDRATGDGWANAADTPAATPVAGLTGVPCRISPVIAGSRETRRPEQAWMENRFHIALGGHYPQINGTQFVVADGVTYEIEPPPQHDGNAKTTRLLCRIVE